MVKKTKKPQKTNSVKEKRPVGRPTVVTKEVIGKLETAFSIGASDEEACFFAGISPDALYDHQKANPEFAKRKAALKEKLVLQSRKVVSDAISKGDRETAKWYLERKKKAEFSTKTDLSHSNPDGSALQTPPTIIQIVPVAVKSDDNTDSDT